MSRFTHITTDGQPVTMVNDNYLPATGDMGPMALVQTRTGIRTTKEPADLLPLGSAEAGDILQEVFQQDSAAAVEEATEDRVVLARWALCLDQARQTLADGILAALQGDLTQARKPLEKALANAMEDLAAFRP